MWISSEFITMNLVYLSYFLVTLYCLVDMSCLFVSILSSCQVVAPIPDVENGKHKGKEDPREDVDFLRLKLEVFNPKC